MITDIQRQARLNGIGGSDMPIILGLSTYKTPYQLYLEKSGQYPGEDKLTSYQYWGNQLESVICNEFATRNNVDISFPETIHHQDYPHLFGNVDGYIKDWNCILEVKNVSQFMAKEWGETETDNIPLPYLVQVAHYCLVSNAKGAYIAALIGGNDYRQYYYERDLELENRLIQEANKFWQCVVNRTAPEPINIDDLKLKYSNHVEQKTKTINSDVSKQLTTLLDIKFKIKELSSTEEECKFKIMKYMEDAEALVDEEKQTLATWKTNKRGSRTFLMKGV